jgi:hypothetical protein
MTGAGRPFLLSVDKVWPLAASLMIREVQKAAQRAAHVFGFHGE